ncbi:MAG: hypothetical protein RMX35_24010 [Nostoc sp. DcaGUA01]|nr:hypothetical protein [Nostoc sp. DcaGUA01]
MPPIFLGKLVLLANYYISEIFMEIPKMPALRKLLAGMVHKINHSVVLIAGNLQTTQKEVFHVGS